ncbi:MAG: sulfur carrier protein ThiS [Actinomycetota bacterium]|nr:sulfur carrier protein ThiS [Actinomycetota bacterium]
MLVTVNGRRRELMEGATVATVVDELSANSEGRGVAVAVENEVVPRGAWSSTQLSEGARVEVLGAIQGG